MASDSPKGWNDPPVLSYGITASDSPSRKTQLNKRVPFPNSGLSNSKSDGSDQRQSPQLLPQIDRNPQNPSIVSAGVTVTQLAPPLPPPSLPISELVAKDATLTEESAGDQQTLENKDLQKDTLSILTQCFADCTKTLQKRTASDIERRLGLLTSMWNEGKLNEDVQIRMYKFSQALRDGDHDLANNIHMSLIVDHASQVTPWMVGIKHLMHESRKIKSHLSSDQSSSNTLTKETNSPSDS